MTGAFNWMGLRIIALANAIGGPIVFAWDCFCLFLRKPPRLKAILDQIYHVGVSSVGTTLAAGIFVGAIMALQINVQLKDFGAQGFLGGLSTSTTIRNVGPVLIAFLLSGKVGAYTSAELGTMQVTDQLNAIRLLGTNPVEYIVLPRMVAVIISSFLLLIIGLMVTIAGGIIFSSTVGVNFLNYIQNIPHLVSWWSVGVGVLKSFCFGVLIAVVACYKGYTAKGGAVGVGESVKSCSVTTLVLIIVTDFSLSMFSGFLQDFFGLGYL